MRMLSERELGDTVASGAHAARGTLSSLMEKTKYELLAVMISVIGIFIYVCIY